MRLMPGQSFGPYRLVEPAGIGGMAEVWRAYDARLDRHVAVKFLSPRYADDPAFLDRFRREARAISRLDHPNILTILDFGEQNGWTYMVSPFIGGGTLASRLGRGPWTVEEAIQVLDPLGSALDYAHEMGIIHRDVKPSNVLFTERGRLVLSDFGVARMLESGTMLSQAGVAIGTPMYMSPEQADGHPAGPASDIYSFGIIAYEVLTGLPPFQAETPLAMLRAHLDKPLPPPRSLNPRLEPHVEATLYRVLAKRPEARFPSAGEVVTALRAPADPDTDRAGHPLLGASTIMDSGLPPTATLPQAGPFRPVTPPSRPMYPPPPGPVSHPSFPPPPPPTRPGGPVYATSGGYPGAPVYAPAPSRAPWIAAIAAGALAIGLALVFMAWMLDFFPNSDGGGSATPTGTPAATSTSGSAVVAAAATTTPTAAVPTPTPGLQPTATPRQATATPQPPTPTPSRPTATPAPPTATPIPPSATPIPPSATPIRQPAEQPVFFAENFDSPARGRLPGQAAESGYAISYEGGEYRLRGTDPSWRGAWVGVDDANTPPNGMIAVDVRLVGPTGNRYVGVACRYHKTIHHEYLFLVYPDLQRGVLWRSDGTNEAEFAVADNPVIRRGNASNRIAISCNGNTISGYVNGVRVVTAQDRSLGSGYMLITTGKYDDPNGLWDARFDNLVISTP
jgi:serine/threonine protein kinase